MVPERAAVISWETELDERHGLARQQDMGRAASVRIVPSMAKVSAEEAAEQLNRRLARKSAAKKGGGRTYNPLSKENGYGGDALWENTANVYNTVVEKVSSNYTVKLDDNGYDINTVKQQIEKGNPVTMSINFKLGGHIIVVVGYTQNGFIVHDPYGNLNKGENDNYGLDTDGAYVEYPYNKWSIGDKWISFLLPKDYEK